MNTHRGAAPPCDTCSKAGNHGHAPPCHNYAVLRHRGTPRRIAAMHDAVHHDAASLVGAVVINCRTAPRCIAV